MARKVKPRWGFELTHNMKDFNRRLDTLETDVVDLFFGPAKANAPPFNALEVTVCFDTFYGEVIDPVDVSYAEMKAAHDVIRNQVRDLQASLLQIDYRSQASIEWAYHHQQLAKGVVVTESSLCLTTEDSRLQTELSLLAEALDAIDLPETPETRGRRPDAPIRTLIRWLAQIMRKHFQADPLEGFYYNAMEERYQGRMIDFLEYALPRFVPELNYSNASLGEHIRRTIGDRSKR